jgi:uncharacterized membrane protein
VQTDPDVDRGQGDPLERNAMHNRPVISAKVRDADMLSGKSDGSFWRTTVSIILGLISAAVGAVDLLALLRFVKVVIALLPVDPLDTLRSHYRDVLVDRLGLILIGVIVLVGILFAFEWYAQAKDWKMLRKRFLIVSAVQIIPLLLGYALPWLILSA